MNAYEMTFIVRPDLDEDATKAAVEQVTGRIETSGGELLATVPWNPPRRRMAYPIRDFGDGYYVTTVFRIDGQGVRPLENLLKLNENVMRFLLVQASDTNIQQAQLRVAQAAAAAARPPVAPAPAPAAPVPTAEPTEVSAQEASTPEAEAGAAEAEAGAAEAEAEPKNDAPVATEPEATTVTAPEPEAVTEAVAEPPAATAEVAEPVAVEETAESDAAPVKPEPVATTEG